MEASLPIPEGFPLDAALWEQILPAAQALIIQLYTIIQVQQQRIDQLEARLAQHSRNSDRPPSSDPPSQRPRAARRSKSGKPGANEGILGIAKPFWRPPKLSMWSLAACPCGQEAFATTEPYYPHQVIELPASHKSDSAPATRRPEAAALPVPVEGGTRVSMAGPLSPFGCVVGA